MTVLAILPKGSGAYVVHDQLAARIPGYRLKTYPPRFEWCPPLLYQYRDSSASVIHTTPDHGCFLASPSQKMVVTFHNYMLDPYMQRYSSLFQRWHYRTDLRFFTRRTVERAAILTAVSKYTAELAAKDLGLQREIKVIPNGVDVARFTPVPAKTANDKVRILFSGNPTLRKGGDLLVEIANKINGAGELWVTAGLRSKKVPVHPRIRTIERVSHQDMPLLYQQVDICLLPTVREGMSLSILEAMASGLPVVASDCSSMGELIVHGQGGYLCPVRDVERYSVSINHLIDDAQKRRTMGEFNRTRAEDCFTLESMVEKYKYLFETLI